MICFMVVAGQMQKSMEQKNLDFGFK